MEIAVRNIVIDCTNPELMSAFWGAFIGYETRWSNPIYRFMLHPDGRRPGLVLQTVPEVATEKNRIHFDLDVADVEAAASGRRSWVPPSSGGLKRKVSPGR